MEFIYKPNTLILIYLLKSMQPFILHRSSSTSLVIDRTLPSGLTGVRIIPIIQTRGLALFSSPCISFLSYLFLPDAGAFEVPYHEGLLVGITPETDDPYVFGSHFVDWKQSQLETLIIYYFKQ